MEGLVAGEGVSPAEFTLSVHHALVGLLSIAQSNRRGHTALAAGQRASASASWKRFPACRIA